MSHWVPGQGFWFQVRHAMATGGARAVVLGHLRRFPPRLGIFVLLVVVAGAIYVVRLPGTKGFQSRLEESVNLALGAKETKLSDFKRVQGEMMIRRFASEGGPKTFYSSLEARNVKGRMGVIDALPGKWRIGVQTFRDRHIRLSTATGHAGARDRHAT